LILHALKGYYEREKENLTPYGFSVGKVDFALVLDDKGRLLQVQDLREMDDRGKPLSKQMKLPSLMKKRSGIAPLPYFAWDKTDYVLGLSAKGKEPGRHEQFKLLMHQLGNGLTEPAMRATLRFLDSWDPALLDRYVEDADDFLGSNLVFRLDRERTYLHEYESVKKAWVNYLVETEESLPGFCLVDGRRTKIARLHLPVKGVRNAQSSGATIVGFNLAAFTSYGKEQNYNAPVGCQSAFEYATALNALLADENHRLQIGDATTVFWTGKISPFENVFKSIFEGQAGEDERLKGFLEAVSKGRQPRELDLKAPFYVLGLSPNQARIAVRFWYTGNVGEMTERVGRHFADLSIERQFENEPEFPGMWRLLVQTAPLEGTKRDSNKIPPVLGGEVMRSILTGAPYPRSLLTGIVNRIRAEQQIGYLQASIIKASLVRNARLRGKPLEVKMSLDTENAKPAYLLGRLFALLEKTQRDALGQKLNRTIRDGYIASASATPRAVFPRLLRLAQHHISKAEYGEFDNKRITEVMDRIEEFPTQLPLEDQGLFFIGYYHQRNAFFKKSKEKDEEVKE
jgi:CRISPR-associated protein Csd1